LYADLKDKLTMTMVSSLAKVRKELFRQEFDFIVVETKKISVILDVVLVAYDLDKEIAVIAFDAPEFHKKIPQVENLYFIPPRRYLENIQEALSFHMSKCRHELQFIYDKKHFASVDRFTFFENAPLGMVLTGTEGNIFYLNQKARYLIGYNEEQRILRRYVDIPHDVHKQLSAASCDLEETYELVKVVDSETYITLRQQPVFDNKELIGFVFFLEDASEKHEQTTQIQKEKEKFERLTGRLNEVLLHELDTNAYNVSYFQRKLDLEIRHTHKEQVAAVLFYFALPKLDTSVSAPLQKKDIVSEATGFLIEQFPDPYIVGHVDNGHWLVITQGDFLNIKDEIHVIEEQFASFIDELTRKLKIEKKITVVSQVITDLRKYSSSVELFHELGIG
ncbi:MAG: PAS domain S-box protein, partial [bacterium]